MINFRLLLLFVNFFFVLCMLLFGYLLLEGKVDEFFEQPIVAESKKYPESGKEGIAQDKIINGIHEKTGLVYAEGFDLVKANCTICHSAKLVTQNRATREGWSEMIDWMQRTQGLWDLGQQEPKILDYLATHYAPEEVGRRANVDVEAIEWYVLELDK